MHLHLRCLASIVIATALLAVDTAQGQMLSRDFRELWQNEVFENYGASGYRDYDFDEENRRFDFFGDLIVDGVDVVQINEVRRNTPGKLGSFETRNARYDRFFDKLIIANEGFGPWSTRLIIGDHITSRFTPMTLNLPQFNGIRWDGSSKKNRFSVLASQLTDRVYVPPNADLNRFFDRRRIFGSSLIGGHWESQVGDLLKLGTTFVNAHRFDGEGNAKANGLKGTIPQAIQGGLRKVFVFFSDDEPTDENPGALIHELVMFANGVEVKPQRVGRIDNLISKVPVTPDPTSTIVLRPNDVTYLRKHRSWLKPVIEASSTPFFIRPIRDVADEDSRMRGISEQVPGATRSAPLRADNTDVVFYEYAMPDSVDDIRFQAVIANDYSVDVVGAVQVRTIAVGDDELFYDWQNVLRADGRPRNSANLRQVEFTYGFPTGLSILGFNFESNVAGFKLRGEFARSLRFLRVPSTNGHRSERPASMFYFNAKRALHERAQMGFEWFDVPEDYTTEFSVFKGTGFANAFTTGGRLYQPVDLVDDNDDLDQWSDRAEHNDPFASFTTSLSGNGNGVFPGLDPDGDGVLDFNVDGGAGSDAIQPFIGYYSEPLDIVYGDDFNNNGIADERENDNLPDYLYQPDHRGVHGFLQIRPTDRTKVKAGSYSIDQEVRGSSNDTHYLEGEFRRDWKDAGYLRLNQRFKWIEDDISNTVYATNNRPGASFARTLDLIPDLLENRDSFNSLTYVECGLQTIRNVNIRDILSYEFTDLAGEIPVDTQLRKPGDITALAVVNKIDYTWTDPLATVERVPAWLGPILERLVLKSQLKHIYQRNTTPERGIPDRQRRWIMPILRVDYRLSPRTILKAGIQGLPLLPETSKDSANPSQDFRRGSYTAFIHNKSNYSGYDLNILWGIFRTKQEFTTASRPSLGYVEYFFRIFIG